MHSFSVLKQEFLKFIWFCGSYSLWITPTTVYRTKVLFFCSSLAVARDRCCILGVMRCCYNNGNDLSNTLHLYSKFRGYALDVNGEYIMTNVLGVKWVTTGEKNVTSTLLSSIMLLFAKVLLHCMKAVLLLHSRNTPVVCVVRKLLFPILRWNV